MKVKVSYLKKALEVVKPGLASKEIIEQTTHFAFTKNAVVTYNDEISILHPIEGISFTGAVHAEELYQFLNKLKKDEIEIAQKENEIQLSCGRIKVGLRLQEEIKLPLETLPRPKNWKPLPKDFCERLTLCMGVCSNDMSTPVLTCIHIRQDGKMEASDGFRAIQSTRKELPVADFLLPALSAVEVVKLNPIEIAESDGWIHFKTKEETVISCRIFEENYPKTDTHLVVKGTAVILPEIINEVLERSMVFSKRPHFMDEMITVTIKENRLLIKGESETGWYEEIINMKYQEDPISFNVTPFLLKNIVTRTRKCVIGKTKIKFEESDWIYVAILTV